MRPDKPKSLADEDEIKDRTNRVYEQHVLKLNVFVDELRERKGPDFYIPCFDPLDGGTNAKALFLLEAPGPKTKASGFISRNNNDLTAQYTFELHSAALISRQDAVLWNIVPWFISKEGKIRPPRNEEIKEGFKELLNLIELLPNLQCIVLAGKNAQKIEPWLSMHFERDLRVFKTPHPSPQFIHRYPENRQILLDSLNEVSTFIGSSKMHPTNRLSVEREGFFNKLLSKARTIFAGVK